MDGATMELERAGLFGRDHELRDDDGSLLAELRYTLVRESGEIRRHPDGQVWPVTRAPRFGPWVVSDAAGQQLASVAKDDAFRERLRVVVDGQLHWLLERRSNLGRRLLVVLDQDGAAEVGRIEATGFSGRAHRLDLPVAPDHVLGLVAWVVGMLSLRDAASAGQQ